MHLLIQMLLHASTPAPPVVHTQHKVKIGQLQVCTLLEGTHLLQGHLLHSCIASTRQSNDTMQSVRGRSRTPPSGSVLGLAQEGALLLPFKLVPVGDGARQGA